MLDSQTIKICKNDPEIRNIKIKNIEHAISQAEIMIKESKMSREELIFLKRKISDSRQDLEILYLMKIQISKSLSNFFLYIWRLMNIQNNVNIKEKLFMSKKNIYIPLKVVPYIFLSMVAITIAATTNIII